MRPGPMRDRLLLMKPVQNRRPNGEDVPRFFQEDVLYGEIKVLRGNELFAVQQTYETATIQVRTRYREGITAKHQLWTHDGRKLSVNAAVPADNRNSEIHIMCTEVKG